MTTFQYLDEGNSEAQDRLASSFLLPQASDGLARTGVLSGLLVTQTTTASGSVQIAAGAAPVQASVGTGVALLVNDTLATLDVFTADPMGGLARNDIVAFDSVTKAIIAIIGTPNASPTDPTVPATAAPLARLRHAASATTIPTAKIDDLRLIQRRPFAEYVATTTSAVDGTFSVTWPTGLFTVAPSIQVTALNGTFAIATILTRSSSGCTGFAMYYTGAWAAGSLPVMVEAKQMTATSAVG